MKKTLFSLLSSVICLTSCFTAVACKKAVPAVDDSNKIITVGASTAPHAEILEFVKPILAEQDYELKIVTFDDYVLPNEGVLDGSLDANYFQHVPYLNSFNSEKTPSSFRLRKSITSRLGCSETELTLPTLRTERPFSYLRTTATARGRFICLRRRI